MQLNKPVSKNHMRRFIFVSIKIACYPLFVLTSLSAIVHTVAGNWDNVIAAAIILLICATLIKFVWWRESVATRKFHSELQNLEGLDKCPISRQQLRELFEFLDRTNPEPCTLRLKESYAFLQERGLEIEQTLKWFHANGAKCDCEVIMNTADRYGEEIGFEPTYDEADDG